MKIKLLSRFIVWVFVLAFSYYYLLPTYQWYFKLTPEEKALADSTKEERKVISSKLEESISSLRTALGDPRYFKISESFKKQAAGEYIFDISYDAEVYNLSLPFDEFYEILNNKILISDNTVSKKLSKEEWKNIYTQAKNNLDDLDKRQKLDELKGKALHLGLDLAGGAYFLLGLDAEKWQSSLDQRYDALLTEDSIRESLKKIDESLTDEEIQNRIPAEKTRLENEKETLKNGNIEERISQALFKISNRVNQFGVSDPVVRTMGKSNIVIELPGETNTDRAKEIFTREGILSFQVVNEEFMRTIPALYKSPEGYIADSAYVEEVKRKKALPSNTTLLGVQSMDKYGNLFTLGYLPVFTKVDLDGTYLRDAFLAYNTLGQTLIQFELNSRGAELFGDMTRNNVGNRIAIILDNTIQSAPYVREAITGGVGSISGNFSQYEAQLLAAILKAGSLPVPLKIMEQRSIGPTLGQEQIRAGANATIIALILISIFLFLYYGFWGGLNANLSQIANVFIILSVMAQLGATLTLPGIVAMLLTVGMSVDANIIIYERLKEDLFKGRTVHASLLEGYKTATKTIIDSNMTTFIPGLVLALIGNGPVRGFGVTLIIGLVANLFTAVFQSHFFYDIFTEKLGVKNIVSWRPFKGKQA